MTLEQFIRAYDLPVLVPVKDVCRVIGIGHSSVYEFNRSGRLTIRKLGGKSGILVDELFELHRNLTAQRDVAAAAQS